MKGEEIVAHDPLQLRFGGDILNVRIRKVSREVLRIRADTSGEIGQTVYCSFEFLDPGDGGVLEVLHTGSAEAPECTGTIMGLPEVKLGQKVLNTMTVLGRPVFERISLRYSLAKGEFHLRPDLCNNAIGEQVSPPLHKGVLFFASFGAHLQR